MAIKEEKPLTLSEVYGLVENNSEATIKDFLKNFIKLKAKEATKLKEELKELDLIKLKETHIVKIVDFLPKDSIELNKILTEISLEEEEINKILDVVKKY